MFLRRKKITSVEDEDLIASIRKGDQQALGGLWDRYAHLLFGVGMKYMRDTEMAKDLVVELFTSLPELLRKHQVDRFRPWVHTVMRNRCLMALRNSRPARSLEGSEQLQAEDPSLQEAVLHEQELQELEKAIQQLEHQQRNCITLFHLEQHSYREIAQITGMPVEAVRSNIQNGRRNLRIILQKNVHRNT